MKKLKADGQDKDGIKEAELRRRLSTIINKYGLDDIKPTVGEDSNSILSNTDKSEEYYNKQIFKDKKLDKLWSKAQKAGLTEEQLKILKEEFSHHQEKVSQYHQLMDKADEIEADKRRRGESWENSIERILEDEEPRHPDSTVIHQALKEKHQDIKRGYEQLASKIKPTDGSALFDDFDEPQVQKLWDLAMKSDFTKDELASLKEELNHYQNRIRKLRHFQTEIENDSISGKNVDEGFENKHLYKKVKELNYKVTKMHNELETRILQRHIEL